MARFEVLAVNDKKDFCECCGRKGLKKVVWIHDTETGSEMHFGTSCALQPIKGFGVDQEIKAAIRAHADADKLAWSIAHRAYRAAGGTYRSSGNVFLATNPELLASKRAEVLASQAA